MSGLGQGIQIVLQTQNATGLYDCEGFAGIPVIQPGLIAIAHAGSFQTQQWTDQLRQELYQAILRLSSTAVSTNVPCNGRLGNLQGCHAHQLGQCQKLLILLGDSATSLAGHMAIPGWLNQNPSYSILPVFPSGSQVTQLLPAQVQYTQAAFWQSSLSEVVPKVLAMIGLTTHESRIFVSYNRLDTQELADQLFDALARENFDVYVDRFRTPPGVDFRVRIEQELLDKAMVLVLESPRIVSSKWCQHEIAFAKTHRLGFLALQMPNGPSLPGIHAPFREALDAYRDFTNPLQPTRLEDDALKRIVQRIQEEHGRAVVRRRQYIRDAMQDALRLQQVYSFQIGADGLLHVQSPASTSARYALWLTTRCPELADFQITDTRLTASESGVVIGPGVLDATRQARMQWLAAKSKVLCFDEGKMLDVAQAIAGGSL